MWVKTKPQQHTHHHGRIGSGREGKAHLQRSFAHRLPLQAMRHEPKRPTHHLETLACEGHAIVVKGSQRGLFHCTYIMSTVQFPCPTKVRSDEYRDPPHAAAIPRRRFPRRRNCVSPPASLHRRAEDATTCRSRPAVPVLR